MYELLWCPECMEWREDTSYLFCTPSCEDCGSELEEKVHPTRVEVDWKNVDSFVNHDDAGDDTHHDDAGGDADLDEDETEDIQTEEVDADDDSESEGEGEGEGEAE